MDKQIAVVKRPDRYISFPALATLDNGEIILAFRSGRNCYRDFPEALNLETQHPHTDPMSEPWIARSTDDGATWTIEDPPRSRKLMDEDHADGIAYQDVGLTKLPDGRLLLNVFRWKYTNTAPPEDLATWVRVNDPNAPRPADHTYDYSRYQPQRYAYSPPPVYSVSDESGRNWSPFKSIDVREPGTGKHWGLATRNGGVVLDEDTIGLPFYTPQGCYLTKYSISADTWSYGGVLAESSDQFLMEEPLLHRHPDGSLLGLYRTTEPGYMFANVSRDNGVTWTEAKQTDVWGHPFAALNTDGGDILLAYGYRREPFGIRISRLRGGDVNSFDASREKVIRDDAPDDDIGYPTMCYARDGSVVLAYYYRSRQDTNPVRYIAVQRLNADNLR